MADVLNLEIITPEKIILNDKIDSITIPGTLGSFQVLKNHAPLISTFEIGIVTIKNNGSVMHYTTSGGTIEVNDNKVLVLADSIEKIEDIDKVRAEDSKSRAEERLKDKQSDIDITRAEAALKRALNRLNAVGKYL